MANTFMICYLAALAVFTAFVGRYMVRSVAKRVGVDLRTFFSAERIPAKIYVSMFAFVAALGEAIIIFHLWSMVAGT